MDGPRLALDPTGRLLATSTPLGLLVFGLDEQRLVARIGGVPIGEAAPSWSSNGRYLLTFSSSQLCLFDVARAGESTCFPTTFWPHFDDDRSLAVLRSGETMRVVDLRTAEVVREHPIPKTSDVRAIGRGGARVVLAEEGHTKVLRFADHERQVFDTGVGSLSADDRYLALEAAGEVEVLDLDRKLVAAHLKGAGAMWSLEGDRVVVADPTGSFAVWDPAWDKPRTFDVQAVERRWFAGPRLAIRDGSSHLRLLPPDASALVDFGIAAPRSVAERFVASPDGAAALAIWPGVRVLDLRSNTVKLDARIPGNQAIYGAFRADAKPVAVVVRPDAIDLFDLSSTEPLARGHLAKYARPTRPEVWIEREGVGVRAGATSVLWKHGTGERVQLGPTYRDPIADRAERVHASFWGGEVILRDAVGEEIARLAGDEAAFSDDGALVAVWTHAYKELSLLAVAKGAQATRVPLRNQARSAMFRPGAHDLAVLTVDARDHDELVLVDGEKRKTGRAFPGVFRARYSPDGALLAVARREGVDVLDAASGRRRRFFPLLALIGAELSWSPDGKLLAVASKHESELLELDMPPFLRVLDVEDGSSLLLGPAHFQVWRADSRAVVAEARGRPGLMRDVLERAPLRVVKEDTIELRSSLRPVELVRDDLLLAQDATPVLVRLSDGAELRVFGDETEKRCTIVAFDDAGTFDGEPGERIAFRLGDDLTTARVDASKETLERHRSPGLLKRFMEKR